MATNQNQDSTKESFKYRFKALLNETPGLMKDKQTAFAKAVGVNYYTVNDWKSLRSNKPRAINTDQLVACAKYFSKILHREITIHDILNEAYPVKEAA